MAGTSRSQFLTAAQTALSILFGAVGTSLILPAPAHAEEPRPADQVLMQADELTYDQATKTVTAIGNVEVAFSQRVMTANKMVYYEETGVVLASGNVVLVEPTGEVIFSDNVELRDELRAGVVDTLQVLMIDQSRLAGTEAQRRNGNITTIYKGVYSPCDVCKEEGKATPLWQIKAFRVIHNQEEQRIIYEDAFFELFGIPIAYIPFFSHPDPTVERQSGFLAPSVGISSDLGTSIQVPYYWVIDENIDATIAPKFMTKENILYEIEYRHRLNAGHMEFDVAAIWPQDSVVGTPGEENFRGSLFSKADFNINDKWRWGFSTELTTDDTFLRRFNLSDETDLTTTAFLRAQDGRNEFSAESFYFQGLLSTDNERTTPVIAPLLNYHYEYPQDVVGGTATADVNVLALNRNDGADSRRISLDLGWSAEKIVSTGEVYSFFTNTRGDIYHTDNVPLANGTLSDPTTVGRVLPTVGAEWRWPLVRAGGTTRQIVEPIVQLIYSPNTGQRDEIPDEDSLSFEFDTTTLFDQSRFAGLDRWEGGTRANAGFRTSVHGEEGGSATLELGQTFRLRENTTFRANSGLRDQESDYVGRIVLTPSESFTLEQRFRVDKDEFTFRRNEVDAYATLWDLTALLGYAYLDESFSATKSAREEIQGSLSYRLTEFWSANAYTRHDLQRGVTVQNYIGLTYQDECLTAGLAFNQNFTRDRDIEPENSIMFTIVLKNLGGTQFTSALNPAE
ncbi:MAG: LPS-assembly protein LptD [Parvibaculum sp.]